MEQISCLLASSLIWVNKSPLSTIQKSIFSFSSILTAYSIGVDRDTGNSTGCALSGIYVLTANRPHIGWIGYGIQGGVCGYYTMNRWINGTNDIDFDDEI